MTVANQMSTLTGAFKEAYGDSVIDLAKFTARLSKRIQFSEQKAVGNKYHQPVDVQMEHGFTCAAANAAGPVTLLAANAGQMQDAQVEGFQLFGRSQVDYEAMFRAASEGKKAFISATKYVVKRLSRAGVKRLEMQLICGQRGIGQAASISGTSTTRAIVIDVETWSAGRWAGSVNATLDAWKADYSAKLNTNALIRVVSVAPSTRTINVSGNATDLGYLDTEVASPTNPATGATQMHLFWETASPTTEMPGLDSQLRNTGTLYNVAGGTYDLWQGNVYSTVTGAASLAKILAAMATPASYGLENDMLAVIAPPCFEVLNSDIAALRAFDTSYVSARAEAGVEALKYHCQTGTVELLSHPLQSDGYIHILPIGGDDDTARRIGATDLTFIKRHGTDEALILELASTAGAEMRLYSNQALFIPQLRHTTIMAGITYA